MQDIIIEKPYAFIPPVRSRFWPWLIQTGRLVDWYLRSKEGVEGYQLRGIDHLRESLRQGHGVMIAPNHCRYADPLVMGWISRATDVPFYAMASWHLFETNAFQRFALRCMGAFSIYREGVDRQSLDLAVEILASGERPLVLFPEGAVFRTNDHLQTLLDGVSFIARTASKKRVKDGGSGRVVIHPVAIKYLFHGSIHAALDPVLDQIESRLTWIHAKKLSLPDRVIRIILALLALKEIEHFGQAQEGNIQDRQQRLIDFLLQPLEEEWLNEKSSGAIIPRVKALRMKILPEMIRGNVTFEDRERRWKHLADIYLAQQIASYPSNYLDQPISETRLLETVERIEEDLTDRTTRQGKLEAVIEIGTAIEVPAERAPRGEEDPLMIQLRESLQSMLDRLSKEARLYQP